MTNQIQPFTLQNELQTLEFEMEGYLKELGYGVQDEQMSRAHEFAGSTGAGGER